MGHKNILQGQLSFKVKLREKYDSILNRGKMTFIGSERPCHLFLKSSRILGFSLLPLLVSANFSSKSLPQWESLIADMLGWIYKVNNLMYFALSGCSEVPYGTRASGLLGWNYHSSLCIFPQSPSLSPPPFLSGTCSLYKIQPSLYEEA